MIAVSRSERQQRYLVEEYLDFEEAQEARHECVGGLVCELPGASVAHSLVRDNLVDALRRRIRGSSHRVYAAAMKLRVGDAFYYPDIMVGASDDPDARYLTAPLIIVEVASGSSEQRDMLEKAVAYRSLPSVREYAVVFEREMRVVIFRRNADGWEQETAGRGDTVRFESVDLSLALEAIYHVVPTTEDG